MAQVSVGQVENLEDLVYGLESVHEALDSACREQVAAAEMKCMESREEAQNSERLLESACQAEQEAQQNLKSAEEALQEAEAALSVCEAQPSDKDGDEPDCSGEEEAVAEAQAAVAEAQAALEQAIENRQRMEHRVECAKQALSMAEGLSEQARQECTTRMNTVRNAIDAGKARLVGAQRALEAYLAAYPPAAQFHSWLHWRAEPGKPMTPDAIRDRISLSAEQQRLLQEYLYDRNPAYRSQVDKYRGDWAAARGDVERNIVNRNVRIHLSGEFAEQMVRQALVPLGQRIETQGRTFVGGGGRYTKTDLLVTGLRVPVVLGRGDGMGAPTGGSMAFEVKCGKSNYLYAQKEHMTFQAEGHKQADAHCTLCSRDIHELPPDKEQELRDTLRNAGSPMVGMLPAKNDVDQACLEFIRQGTTREERQ